LLHFLKRDRNGEADRLRAIIKAMQMLRQAEHAAIVDADALKHAVAVEQAVVEDGDLRLGFRNELAVEVDEEVCRHEGA